jgi:hypothetical protein
MKKVIAAGLATLLCVATTGATAGDRGHGNGHGKGHYKHKDYHYYQHRPSGYYKPYRPYGYRWYYGGPPRYNDYYASYLGAALIGSALTYSLYHTHNGAYCYDNHGGDRYQLRSSVTEVVGCHRIVRLPDGSERRVEVPLSECR